VRWAVEQFTQAGEWLLDPFVGSGTSLVEARLLGRHALAAEIDPLARLMAHVKATPLDPDRILAAKDHIDRFWENSTAADGHARTIDLSRLPDFPRRDYWFHSDVQRDLLLLRDAISSVADDDVRQFLLVVYSSTIIAKGLSSVANALDIAHSRAHHIDREQAPDVWKRFCDRFGRALRAMRAFHTQADPQVQICLNGVDARTLPYADRSADLIFTSPPYVTAIEYPRSHKFSVWWIGEQLGVSHRVYEQLSHEYIGTESVTHEERMALRARATGLPTVDRVALALDDVDAVRAGRARRYFADMRQSLTEMLRTLKPERYALLVVADSTMRGVTVPTGACLAEIAESLEADHGRFVHCDTLVRAIRERSRQMPIKRGANGEAMKTEEIVILQRRSARRTFRV
jgi:hypothetical protein